VRRLTVGIFALVFAAAFSQIAVAFAQGQGAAMPPPANFGSPPSGQIPILFNDHHVYAKPDTLKQGRVLAALVRGGTVLIPLRSMFEQMGASVSYDPATKTADVSKPGSDVKVTVGKPEVTINGESRPLDVPPEIYKGAIVVPVRVISEGMGAYVQWVPDKKVVVVRYVAAPIPTPPPTAPPTAPPTPKPTPKPVPPPPPPPPPPPTPAPTAKPVNYEHFIVGDYIFHPKVYNEFSGGNIGNSNSFDARGALEFPALGLPWMVEGDYRSYSYQHNSGYPPPGTTTAAYAATACNYGNYDPGCVATIGGGGAASYVPGFTATDTDIDGRLGLKVVDPRIYIGIGYLSRSENYGYPRQGGVGFGLEKLPDLDQAFSIYGSVYYYPNVSANYTIGGVAGQFSYRDLKYQVGATYTIGSFTGFGLFIDGGYEGDSLRVLNLAPAPSTHSGAYLGLGLKF